METKTSTLAEFTTDEKNNRHNKLVIFNRLFITINAYSLQLILDSVFELWLQPWAAQVIADQRDA